MFGKLFRGKLEIHNLRTGTRSTPGRTHCVILRDKLSSITCVTSVRGALSPPAAAICCLPVHCILFALFLPFSSLFYLFFIAYRVKFTRIYTSPEQEKTRFFVTQ